MAVNKKSIFIYMLDVAGIVMVAIGFVNLGGMDHFELSSDSDERVFYAWLLIVFWFIYFIPRIIYEFKKVCGISKCNNCGGNLKEEDFVGTFTTPIFIGYFTKIMWPIPRLILSMFGIILINMFFDDPVNYYLKVVFFLIVVILISFRFMAHMDNLIYRCQSCDGLYKGIKQVKYRYGR